MVRYTFIEEPKNPQSCTIIVKGPNEHTIAQLKDAIRDGLRAVKNTVEDEAVVAGAGAFEMAASCELVKFKETVTGRAKLGIQAFADALLVIPKTLAVSKRMQMRISACHVLVVSDFARFCEILRVKSWRRQSTYLFCTGIQ